MRNTLSLSGVALSVRKSALFLDEHGPSRWANKLLGVDFNVRSPKNCILEHVFAGEGRPLGSGFGFTYGIDLAHELSPGAVAGFCIVPGVTASEHNELWRQEIERRIKPETGHLQKELEYARR